MIITIGYKIPQLYIIRVSKSGFYIASWSLQCIWNVKTAIFYLSWAPDNSIHSKPADLKSNFIAV